MSILITSEWPYCAYPLVIETYSLCNYGCLYCFTKHKETWHNNAKIRKIKGFDSKRDVINLRILERALCGLKVQSKQEMMIKHFVDNRIAFQVGGQTDPFGEYEKKNKATLKLLELLKNKGSHYPIRLSTKGMVLSNKEYLDVLTGYENSYVLISLISMDENKLSLIEPNTPTAGERLELMKLLSERKIKVGLRLRPIIPNFTESTIEELIVESQKNGCSSVTVEWLRIPRTMTQETKERYERMSNIVGYDIVQYYHKHSDVSDNRNGYLRLKPEVTQGLYKKIISICKKNKINLSSCNKDFRCYGTSTPNCCGVGLEDLSWNRMQFSYAVYLAKKHGLVKYSDIYDKKSPLNFIINDGNFAGRLRGLTYEEALRKIWNDVQHRYYPANFFPELKFVKKDCRGNHIFGYDR